MRKVARKKLSDSVIDEIRRMILRGELREGDKLPNQNEFAGSLGVSRPSLREALQTLNRLGAIEQRPGLGTVLISRAPVLLASNLELPFMSDAQGTIELIETRRLFETGMIALAVVRASEDEIAQIGRVLDGMQRALQNQSTNDYQQQDLIFHSLIANAAHNRFVTHVFQAIRRSFEQFLKEAFTVLPKTMNRSMVDHQEIHEALKGRDQERAVAAMNNHLIEVQKTMKAYYQISNRQQGNQTTRVGNPETADLGAGSNRRNR
jgi:GntR family transcriptional repressor for pyruvate dehydrogenase complex